MRPGTVYTVLEETARAYPEMRRVAPAHRARMKYRNWTCRQYRDTVRQIAVGFRALGIRKGEIVGLQSETRAEFYLADLGLMACGAVAAALYTSLPYEEQAENA